MPCGEGFDDPIKQSRRQEAVIVTVTTADLPDVIAGPFEFVALRNDDPRTLVIQSEMALDRDGNFDRAGGIDGRRMRDRKDDNDRCFIRGLVVRRPARSRTDDLCALRPVLIGARGATNRHRI